MRTSLRPRALHNNCPPRAHVWGAGVWTESTRSDRAWSSESRYQINLAHIHNPPSLHGLERPPITDVRRALPSASNVDRPVRSWHDPSSECWPTSESRASHLRSVSEQRSVRPGILTQPMGRSKARTAFIHMLSDGPMRHGQLPPAAAKPRIPRDRLPKDSQASAALPQTHLITQTSALMPYMRRPCTMSRPHPIASRPPPHCMFTHSDGSDCPVDTIHPRAASLVELWSERLLARDYFYSISESVWTRHVNRSKHD